MARDLGVTGVGAYKAFAPGFPLAVGDQKGVLG
jgi:hypothetical protein